jgi:hypothetical protein
VRKSKTDAKKRNVNHGAFGGITGTLKQMESKQVPVNMKPVPNNEKKATCIWVMIVTNERR